MRGGRRIYWGDDVNGYNRWLAAFRKCWHRAEIISCKGNGLNEIQIRIYRRKGRFSFGYSVASSQFGCVIGCMGKPHVYRLRGEAVQAALKAVRSFIAKNGAGDSSSAKLLALLPADDGQLSLF